MSRDSNSEGTAGSKPYKDCSSVEKHQRILLAIEAIYDGGFNPNGEPLYPIRQASRDFDIPFSTLQGRFRGRKSKTEAHEHQRHFTTAEEQVLVDWIKTLGRRGVPMTLSTLREFAEGMLGHSVGENWAYQFVHIRHTDLKVRLLCVHTCSDLLTTLFEGQIDDTIGSLSRKGT